MKPVRVMDYEYRERGTSCLRVANEIENPRHRAFLIEMGHAWMRLHEQARKNQADLTHETPRQSGRSLNAVLRHAGRDAAARRRVRAAS
jgi:hypothetical protein